MAEEDFFQRADRVIDDLLQKIAEQNRPQPEPTPPQRSWAGPIRQDSTQPRQQTDLASDAEAQGELNWELIRRLTSEQYDSRRTEIQRWIAGKAAAGHGSWR